jgi:hypothetical protein
MTIEKAESLNNVLQTIDLEMTRMAAIGVILGGSTGEKLEKTARRVTTMLENIYTTVWGEPPKI